MTNPLLNELFPPTLTFFHPFEGLTGWWSTYIPAGNAVGTAIALRFEAYSNGNTLPGSS